jgi:hypothetical protein
LSANEWDDRKVQTHTAFPYWIEEADRTREAHTYVEIRPDEFNSRAYFHLVNARLQVDADPKTRSQIVLRHPWGRDIEGDRSMIFTAWIDNMVFLSAYGSVYRFSGYMVDPLWYVDATPFDGVERADDTDDFSANYGYPYQPNPVDWKGGPTRVFIEVHHSGGEGFEGELKLRKAKMLEAKEELRASQEERKAKQVAHYAEFREESLAEARKTGRLGQCVSCGGDIYGHKYKGSGNIEWYHVGTHKRECFEKSPEAQPLDAAQVGAVD